MQAPSTWAHVIINGTLIVFCFLVGYFLTWWIGALCIIAAMFVGNLCHVYWHHRTTREWQPPTEHTALSSIPPAVPYYQQEPDTDPPLLDPEAQDTPAATV